MVGESGLAEEARRRIPALRPHVAVLDGRLPDGSGIDVCRDIRSAHPEIAALILTSYDDDEALFSAIMAGAAGYVLKQIRGNDLLDAVRRVAAGQSLLDPAVTAQVLDRLRQGPPEDKALAPLTDQELKILELIGEGLTNRQIGERMFLAEKTVKNYVSSLLSKLGLERRTQAAVFADQAPAAGLTAGAGRRATRARRGRGDVGPRPVGSAPGPSCGRRWQRRRTACPAAVLDAAVPRATASSCSTRTGGIPARPGVVHETCFVGPGMRRSPTLSYVPARLSLVPRLFATTLPPDVVCVTVAPPLDGRLLAGHRGQRAAGRDRGVPGAWRPRRRAGQPTGCRGRTATGCSSPTTSTSRSRRTTRSTSPRTPSSTTTPADR